MASLIWGRMARLQVAVDDYGIGRYTADIGLSRGSVRDLAGSGLTIGGQTASYGLSVNLTNDASPRLTGFEFHLGGGYNVGGAGTLTGVGSVRMLMQ